MKKLLSVFFLNVSVAAGAIAADIKVLSGGAVEPGLHAFAAQVKRELEHELKIQFNTTPQIVQRLAAGEVYDIVIVPPAVIEQAAKDGKVAANTRVTVGRVGAGIFVRSAAAAPSVGNTAIRSVDTTAYDAVSSTWTEYMASVRPLFSPSSPKVVSAASKPIIVRSMEKYPVAP